MMLDPVSGPADVPWPARLGRAPELLLLSAIGVVLVAVAYANGRAGRSFGMAVYWMGHLLVFVPVAARIFSRRLAGQVEAFTLVVGLAVNQYLVKWMYSPDQFRFPDELQHWRGTDLIIRTGALFELNRALPVSSYFPGLEEMGAAVSSLTGLTVTASGMIVAGVAHLAFVGGLFLLVTAAGGTPTLAAAACVVYATAGNYLFFDSMYIYQTGALPFFALVLWVTRVWTSTSRHGRSYAVIGFVAVAMVVVTHHVTAGVMVGVLVLLAACETVLGQRRRGTTVLTAWALVCFTLWIAFPARATIAYFEPPIQRLVKAVTGLFGDSTGGASSTGRGDPIWELAIQAVALLVLGVIFLRAATVALRGRERNAWQWALLLGAAAFLAGNGLRFVGSQGPELAGRAATFTYLPMAILAAAALLRWQREQIANQLRRTVATGTAVALLMVAARAGGWPPYWARLPGPHLVSGFERGIDPQGVAAARWSRSWLGPGHRFGADITGAILAAAYGGQDPVGDVGPLYTAPRWGLAEAQRLDQLAVDYLWVDLRLTTQTPASGAYFAQDPLAGRYTQPLPLESLTKFDGLAGIERVYDSGAVRIYDVRDL